MHTDTTTNATADDSKFWTTRNYILAALGGTLAVTAIIIAVSVVLSPAHISFSIVHASKSDPRANKDGTPIQSLNLTIAATNASRKRAAVRYQGIFVDLKNSSSAAGRNTIHAVVYASPRTNEYLLPGTGPAIINASVYVLATGATSESFAGRRLNGTGFTVVLSAAVRFRVAGVRTRVYDIKVSCPRVTFPLEGSSNVTAPPIDCTA